MNLSFKIFKTFGGDTFRLAETTGGTFFLKNLPSRVSGHAGSLAVTMIEVEDLLSSKELEKLTANVFRLTLERYCDINKAEVRDEF